MTEWDSVCVGVYTPEKVGYQTMFTTSERVENMAAENPEIIYFRIYKFGYDPEFNIQYYTGDEELLTTEPSPAEQRRRRGYADVDGA